MAAAPTIVVNAFNRPHALKRLLGALENAVIPTGTRLIISIDAGGDPEVVVIAETWPWHKKEIILQPKTLGLVGHFLACGDLAGGEGDFIYLEDDLFVSPHFYDYAFRALERYREESAVAGVSLNSLQLNGYTHSLFIPLPDGWDNFFLQVFWYQGQAFTADMWRAFRSWWDTADRMVWPADGLHPAFNPAARWRDDFFPAGMKYLHQTGKYFVFPRQSLSTNFGDAGTHFAHPTLRFQVPILQSDRPWRFSEPAESGAVYDSYFELIPERLAESLGRDDFAVDLNATRPSNAVNQPFVLTTRRARQTNASWGLALRPPEANLLQQIPGNEIRLARKEAVRFSPLQTWLAQRDHATYFRPFELPLRKKLLHLLSRAIFPRDF